MSAGKCASEKLQKSQELESRDQTKDTSGFWHGGKMSKASSDLRWYLEKTREKHSKIFTAIRRRNSDILEFIATIKMSAENCSSEKLQRSQIFRFSDKTTDNIAFPYDSRMSRARSSFRGSSKKSREQQLREETFMKYRNRDLSEFVITSTESAEEPTDTHLQMSSSLEMDSKAMRSDQGLSDKGTRQSTQTATRLYLKNDYGAPDNAPERCNPDTEYEYECNKELPVFDLIRYNLRPTLRPKLPFCRDSKLRNSYHGFTKMHSTLTTSQWLDIDEDGRYREVPEVDNPRHELKLVMLILKMRCCVSYTHIMEASRELQSLRISNTISEAEIKNELRLIHALERWECINKLLKRPSAIPLDTAFEGVFWTVHVADLAFRLKEFPTPAPACEEVFVCMVGHVGDVAVLERVRPRGGYVRFSGILRYYMKVPKYQQHKFKIDITVYSMEMRRRSAMDRTKQFFKKMMLSPDALRSNFTSHGKITFEATFETPGQYRKSLDYSRVARLEEISFKFAVTKEY